MPSPDLLDESRYPPGSFGLLRVVARAGKRGKAVVWRCQCDPALGGCGRYCEAKTSHLLAGDTRSCGCLRRRPPEAVAPGLTCGRLRVEEEVAPDPKDGERRFRVRCAEDLGGCGAEVVLNFSDLGEPSRDHRRSCRACAERDLAESQRAPNLVGREFGTLRVRARVQPKVPHRWRADCAPDLGGCGGEWVGRGCSLLDGRTTSCGCGRGRARRRRRRRPPRPADGAPTEDGEPGR